MFNDSCISLWRGALSLDPARRLKSCVTKTVVDNGGSCISPTLHRFLMIWIGDRHEDTPGRVGGKANGDGDEQGTAEFHLAKGVQNPPLICCFTASSGGEHERENADQA